MAQIFSGMTGFY